jgi:hypothetical protein
MATPAPVRTEIRPGNVPGAWRQTRAERSRRLTSRESALREGEVTVVTGTYFSVKAPSTECAIGNCDNGVVGPIDCVNDHDNQPPGASLFATATPRTEPLAPWDLRSCTAA